MAAAPATALASTYTVDDNKLDCPNASFTSIQAAVNQAAPHDTIRVCPGLYKESSVPNTSAASPSQAGSHNGLTITKPLNIVGAGSSKVTIEPDSAVTTTLAGTAPYLRDGGGNVITISRQSLGSTDQDDTVVNISGVTITSPDVYAEAGVSFFNASGSITNSVVGPLASATSVGSTTTASPYGWGVIATDSLQGAGTGTARREVDISSSLVSGYQAGGLLFDDSFGADAATTVNQRSGIMQYAYVDHTRVQGDPTSTIPQTGIEYRAGQRGAITNSEITANPGRGVLLADADTSASDPTNPTVPSFYMSTNSITGNSATGLNNGVGIFNAAIDGTTISNGPPAIATGSDSLGANWFGCANGPVVTVTGQTDPGCQKISGPTTNTPPGPSVLYNVLRAPTAPLTVPGPTEDDAPTAAIVDPVEGGSVTAGTEVDPVVTAHDDFGVQSVDLTADGTDLGAVGHTPYEYTWTPTTAQIGKTVALVATVTDSSGQTTTSTVHVTVAAPAGYTPITVDPATIDFGALQVGSSTTKTITVTDSGDNPLSVSGFIAVGSGFAVTGGTCTTTTTLAAGESCTVIVGFTPVAAVVHAGSVQIAYTAPGGGDPIAVALSGHGTPKPGPGAPPVPKLSGTPHVGSTLTCAASGAGWDYGWYRGTAAIGGAKGATYTLAKADTDALVSCRITGDGGTTGSAGKRVSFPHQSTKTTKTVQVGPSIVTLHRSIKGASKLAVGSVYCAPAAGATCTATTAAKLKVGKKTYAVSATTKVTSGGTGSLALKLPSKAAKAVKKSKGTLTLSVTVVGSSGRKGSAKTTLSTKKGA